MYLYFRNQKKISFDVKCPDFFRDIFPEMVSAFDQQHQNFLNISIRITMNFLFVFQFQNDCRQNFKDKSNLLLFEFSDFSEGFN